jgi:hypothetical protein
MLGLINMMLSDQIVLAQIERVEELEILKEQSIRLN